MDKPFHWLEDATTTIAVTSSSANGKLLKVPTGVFQLRVYNGSTSPVFIRKAKTASDAASATDMPIAPGAAPIFTINNTDRDPIGYLAAICPAGTGNIYATVGAGDI